MQDYAKLWLGYTPKKNNRGCAVLRKIRLSGAPESDRIVGNAVRELRNGFKEMLDLDPQIEYGPVGTGIAVKCGADLQERETYSIAIENDVLSIEGKSATAILYGVFDVLRTIACEQSVTEVYAAKKTVRPSNPLRMLNRMKREGRSGKAYERTGLSKKLS